MKISTSKTKSSKRGNNQSNRKSKSASGKKELRPVRNREPSSDLELADVVAKNAHLNGRSRNVIEDVVSKLLYNETRRRPMVFSIVNEV